MSIDFTAQFREGPVFGDGPLSNPHTYDRKRRDLSMMNTNKHTSLLGAMRRRLHDILPDDLRQELITVIPDLPGTAGDGHDEERSYLALDWLIRTWLPAWLELSPSCREDAARVRDLGRIVDRASAERAGPVVLAASKRAAAAWAAAGAVAGAVAGSAARAAVRDAAWAAASDAAGAAAWAAALTASPAAAWAAAGDAAWAAAWAAAGDAAWAAARAAARDAARDAAWDAAWDAAGNAAKPTVERLQRSAIDLCRRMALVGREGGR